MSGGWVGIFQGVAESLVDEVLVVLADSGKLPERSLVAGQDMPMLAALAHHWGGQVEIVTVLTPGSLAPLADAIETIATNEGIDVESALWIDPERVRVGPEGPTAPVVPSGRGVAHDLALSVLGALESRRQG